MHIITCRVGHPGQVNYHSVIRYLDLNSLRFFQVKCRLFGLRERKHPEDLTMYSRMLCVSWQFWIENNLIHYLDLGQFVLFFRSSIGQSAREKENIFNVFINVWIVCTDLLARLRNTDKPFKGIYIDGTFIWGKYV